MKLVNYTVNGITRGRSDCEGTSNRFKPCF